MSWLDRYRRTRQCALGLAAASLLAAGVMAGGAAAQLSAAEAAQLPATELPGGAGEQIQQAVDQPLPGPAEETVESSPVAPVRETVRETVGGAVGGGGSGGGHSGSPASRSGSGSGSGSAGARTPSGASANAPGRGSGDGAARPGDSARRRSRSDRRAAQRRAARRRAAEAGATRERRSERSSAGRRGGGGDEAGVGARLRDIVEVVPGWVKAALAALALLAVAFGARMLVERRRARRFHGERERLQRNVGVLQSALLPEAPDRIGTLAASVSYRPAEGLAAGGDFYDLFELADGRVAVMVGDVSGHGQDALMRTASVRHSLGAYLRAGTDARGALAAAGELLPMGDDGRFTTVVLALYDPEAGTLTYSCAGHPPPIFTGAAAHEPISAAASPPVGVGVPTGLRQTTVSLPPGSSACLFTDGLIEARCDDGLLGRERLAELMNDLPDEQPADTLIERVDAVAAADGDDLAVCVLRATAGPSVLRPRVEELEVGPAEADLKRAERLLEACGFAESEADEVRDELVAAGRALLRVTLERRVRAEVEPLGEPAGALLAV